MTDETLGLDRSSVHKRVHENGPAEHELAIPLAGALHPYAYVSPHINRCGDISNGVSFRFSTDGRGGAGFILPFEQLERWYLAAKAVRDRNPERDKRLARDMHADLVLGEIQG